MHTCTHTHSHTHTSSSHPSPDSRTADNEPMDTTYVRIHLYTLVSCTCSTLCSLSIQLSFSLGMYALLPLGQLKMSSLATSIQWGLQAVCEILLLLFRVCSTTDLLLLTPPILMRFRRRRLCGGATSPCMEWPSSVQWPTLCLVQSSI